jgi:NAD-dependent SIR2 family protein deacetylase
VALATLERHEWLGVSLEDSHSSSCCPKELYPADDKHDPSSLSFGQERRVSVITQNVDSLHRRAGTRHLVELHGRTDLVECLHCGHTRSRNSFHQELEAHNPEWFLALQQQQQQQQQQPQSTMRADGDAQVADLEDFYSQLHIPACSNCRIGFYKPSVVFFGDSVPRHRVRLCEAVIQRCDKLLVVGSSLAVHSAYRHVKAAQEQNKDICILNVGTTRAEVEGLLDNNVVPTTTTRTSGTSSNPRRLKLEAPAGPVLHRVVELLLSRDTTQ